MKSPMPFKHVPSTGSTNQDLLDAARSGRLADNALLTDSQTAGRGRLARRWHNDEAEGGRARSMLGSVAQLWSPTHPSLPLVPFAVGLAVLETVESIVGASSGVGLGWPNDVVVERAGSWRKLAGILVETAPLAGTDSLAVVIGVGMNLVPIESSDGVIRQRAISLTELGAPGGTSNVEAFRALLASVERVCDLLRSDPAATMATYRSRCVTLGLAVNYQTADGSRTGEATDVLDTGALRVQTAAGPTDISVGDVTIR